MNIYVSKFFANDLYNLSKVIEQLSMNSAQLLRIETFDQNGQAVFLMTYKASYKLSLPGETF